MDNNTEKQSLGYWIKPEFDKERIRVVNADDIEYLRNVIGEKALRFIKENGATIIRTFETNPYVGVSFAVEYQDKVLFFNSFKRQKSISVGFMRAKDFQQRKSLPQFLTRMKADKQFTSASNQKLTEGTLKFLRFAGGFIVNIADDCRVSLGYSTKRRESIYRRYFEKFNKPNIHIEDDSSRFDDRKNKKFRESAS